MGVLPVKQPSFTGRPIRRRNSATDLEALAGKMAPAPPPPAQPRAIGSNGPSPAVSRRNSMDEGSLSASAPSNIMSRREFAAALLGGVASMGLASCASAYEERSGGSAAGHKAASEDASVPDIALAELETVASGVVVPKGAPAGSAARPTYLPISFAAEDALDEQGKEKFASAVQRRLAQFALQARAFSAFAEQTDRGDVSMDAAQDVSCQPPTLEATLTEVAAQDPALAAGAPLWLTGGKPPVPTQQPLPTTAAAAAESAGGVDADAAGAVPQQTGAAWDPLNVFRGRRISVPTADAFEAQLLACGLRYGLLSGVSGCAAAAAEAAASLKVPLAAEVLSAIAAAPPAAGEGGEIMHFVALLLVGCAAGLVSRSATGGILTALHGDAKAGAQAATAGGDAGTARAASDLKLADSPGHGSGKENVDPVAPGTPPRTFAASGKKGAASPPDCGEGWQSAFDEEKPAERCENRAKAARLYVAGRNAARLSRAACIGGLQNRLLLAGAVAGALSVILWQPVDSVVRKKLLSRLHDVTGSRQNATALIATADVAVVVAVEVACFSLGLDPIFFV